MREDDDLKLKSPLEEKMDCALTECPPDTPSDDDDFEKQRKRLEMKETSLKFSMRRIVAGFLTSCATLIMGTYVFHLISPYSWHWLSPCQLKDIKDVAVTVFGGLALSIGTLFFSKK